MKTFGDVLDFLRNEVLRDTSVPPLWTDDALVEYIAQAHDEFAERTLYIRDSSSEVTQFQLEAGVDTYQLNAVVLAVHSARVEGMPEDLVRAGNPALGGYTPPPDTVSWLEAINNGVSEDGTPRVFTTDDSSDGKGAVSIRVWPVPAAADAGKLVQMRVTRLTTTPCSLDNLDDEPECPRQHMLALVHGAAALAYDAQDSDGNDPVRASKQRAKFEEYITRASVGRRRRMFQPLSWGFGRGGFSHSR